MRLFILFILTPFLVFSQTQIGNDIEGESPLDHSGYSVSISADGSTIAVGSPSYSGSNPGHVRVYHNNEGSWTQIGDAILGENSEDHFGSSVSLSSDGSMVAIGGPDNAETPEIAGHVRVFENIGDVWIQIGDDIDGVAGGTDKCGSPINRRFGTDVRISNDGTNLAIAQTNGSSCLHGDAFPGYIHLYDINSGNWTQIGSVIDTGLPYITDLSISGDGSMIAVSGFSIYSIFYLYGKVKIYKNESGVWNQLESSFNGVDEIYSSVCLTNNGSKIAIGGDYIRVYENIDDQWVQEGEDIVSENVYNADISFSGDGTILAVGGPVTRLYENYSSGDWTQLGVDIHEEASGDGFGYSLALSNDGMILAVGAPFNGGNGDNAGHARVYDFSTLLSSDEFILTQFSLYPNPAQDQFTIELKNSLQLERINIYNNLGQFIKSTSKKIVNTSSFSSGIYFVEVITNKGKANKKLILK